jgi:zinc transporter ZupT
MSKDREQKGFGKDFSKGLMLATGLPVMVILGVLVGYYIGRDYGSMAAGLGALAGGMLGLAWTVIEAIRWSPSEKQKKK